MNRIYHAYCPFLTKDCNGWLYKDVCENCPAWRTLDETWAEFISALNSSLSSMDTALFRSKS